MVNLYDLHESDIDINSIAHSLARLCRYNGQVAGFISVGRHSIRCCLAAIRARRIDVALECLGHDFGEAFFGDLVRPLKNDPVMRPRYLEIEEAGEVVICKALGLNYPFDPFVKEMDMMDSQLEMGVNNDGERFDPNRWDDIQQTENDIVYMYHWLIAERAVREACQNVDVSDVT
jgi:hypothetical protein